MAVYRVKFNELQTQANEIFLIRNQLEDFKKRLSDIAIGLNSQDKSFIQFKQQLLDSSRNIDKLKSNINSYGLNLHHIALKYEQAENQSYWGLLSSNPVSTGLLYVGGSFHDINCFSDPQRLDSLLNTFNRANWKNLSRLERERAIKNLSWYIIDVLKIENPPIIVFSFWNDKEAGEYHREINALRINEEHLNDPYLMINTIAHELCHAYQHQYAMDHPNSERTQIYNNEFGDNYIKAGSAGYRDQTIEKEARKLALIFCKPYFYQRHRR